jgi:SAM-dependent methyltransferase
MSVYACRLCAHTELSNPLVLGNSPRNIQRLYSPEMLWQDRSVELRVLQCVKCGFVQLDPMLDDEYYDDYLMGAPHSVQMQAYQQRQAKAFVRDFDLVGKTVKEIGSGDGCYLGHLREEGCNATGIEPSAKSRIIALAAGHCVEDGYVTADRELEAAPYDAFVTRQVLEHVPDIHGFLTGIRRNLKPGAVGLVEVPSLEKALKDRRFYDFFPDHVNYFSVRTLRLALETNGFNVLEVRHDMFDEYIIAYVRRFEHPVLDEIAATVSSLGDDLRRYVADCHSAGRKVAIWGAGGKGLSVMASAGISEVDLLVDSDPIKQGLVTPVTHLHVEPPEAIAQHNIDAVIVTAMAYKNEILRTLREDLGFRGEIVVLGHNLERIAPDIFTLT